MPGRKGPKAVSKAQQATAGMAHAMQKGDMPMTPGTPAAKMAANMKPGDAKSMASGPMKGKPGHAGMAVKTTNTGGFSKKKF